MGQVPEGVQELVSFLGHTCSTNDSGSRGQTVCLSKAGFKMDTCSTFVLIVGILLTFKMDFHFMKKLVTYYPLHHLPSIYYYYYYILLNSIQKWSSVVTKNSEQIIEE